MPADDPSKALEIGTEATPEEYVARLVRVFREVRRVLKPSGSLWVNLGDAHANDAKWGGATGGKHVAKLHGTGTGIGRQKHKTGIRPKNLYGLPFMLAFALRADGWTWQSCSPWIKRNVMPESTKDRPCHAVEYILQFGATERPWADMHAVLVPYARQEGSGNGFVRPERRTAQNGDGTSRGVAEPWVPNRAGRHRRDSDPFMESLRTLAEGGEGLLVEDCDPLAFVVNPKPYKSAFYAAYPVDLVVPILRFACPPKVCTACGAPWVRLPRSRAADAKVAVRVRNEGGRSDGYTRSKTPGGLSPAGTPSHRFVPACSCPEGTPTRPGVVLDPFIGCYDEQTRVYTRRGLVSWSEVTAEDEFVTRQSDGGVAYRAATAIQCRDYCGPMHHYIGRSLDLLVTPDHQMLVREHHSESLALTPSSTLTYRWYGIPNGGLAAGVTPSTIDVLGFPVPAEPFMRYLGLFLAEGHVCWTGKGFATFITQSKTPAAVEHARAVVKALPVGTYREHFDRSCGKWSFVRTDPALHAFCRALGRQPVRRIPRWVFDLGPDLLRPLWEELLFGDGTVLSNGSRSYSTSSEGLAQDVAELVIRLGFGATLRSRIKRDPIIRGRRVFASGPEYGVGVRHARETRIDVYRMRRTVQYTGKVYCATVPPNHTLLVERNGKIAWCGNSGTTGQAAVQEGRDWIGIDFDPRNEALVRERVAKVGGEVEVVTLEARGDEVMVVPAGTTASAEPDPPAPTLSPASPTPRPFDGEVIEGDCVEVMDRMAAGSVAAVCTDPPYLLTGTGKNGLDCLTRILAEVQFPQDEQLDVESLKCSDLPIPPNGSPLLGCLDRSIRVDARICVPEGSVDLKHPAVVEQEIASCTESSRDRVTDAVLAVEAHSEFPEHLGNFVLQPADGGDTAGCDGACCCYTELGFGRIAVLISAVDTAVFPRLLTPSLPVSRGDGGVLSHLIGVRDNARHKARGAPLVVAGPRAEHGAVLTLDLRRAAGEIRAAHSTGQSNLLPRRPVAMLVAARSVAVKHVSMLQPCRVRVINGATTRTLTLYIPLHRFASLDGSAATGGFMGKAWDGGVSTPQAAFRWHLRWLQAARRVLALGAPLTAFSGGRTFHRLAAAMEEAGFTGGISLLAWVHSQGFPKGQDLGRLIDKAAGAERPVIGYDETRVRPNRKYASGAIGNVGGHAAASDRTDNGATQTGPATPEAAAWTGWSSQLKPTFEPVLCVHAPDAEGAAVLPRPTGLRVIHLLRKPLGAGNLAANVLRWGCGGLHIDAGRIGTADSLLPLGRPTSKDKNTGAEPDAGRGQARREFAAEGNVKGGRHPANLLLVHLPGCRVVGTTKVKGITGGSLSGSNALGQDSGWNSHQNRPIEIRRPNSGGTETVTAWDCESRCPVAAIDASVGGWTSQTGNRRKKNRVQDDLRATPFAHGLEAPEYTDKGGPSRFWFQSPSEGDLYVYLRKLIAPDHLPDCNVPEGPQTADDSWRLAPDDSLHGLILRVPADRAALPALAADVLRVLRPGAHLLLVAPEGEPTGHAGACACEDAGFEVRDALLVVGPGVDADNLPLSYCAKAAASERWGLRRCSVCDYREVLPASKLRKLPKDQPCPKCGTVQGKEVGVLLHEEHPT